MTFNVSAWSIRKPVPALVFFVVMLVLGLTAFRSLPIALTPNIDIAVVSVLVTQSGAAPVDAAPATEPASDAKQLPAAVAQTVTIALEGV